MAIRIKRRYDMSETEVRSWWAWWPCRVKEYQDDRIIIETRWLQRVYVEGRYSDCYPDGLCWIKIRFTNEGAWEQQRGWDRRILDRPR